MNLYRISQKVNDTYDTYDSAIVCADSEDAARMIHPDGDTYPAWDTYSMGTWCTSPEHVTVALIGTAIADTPAGVVLAPFNAG